jgi:hypothetical protein
MVTISRDNFDLSSIIPHLRSKTDVFEYHTDESFLEAMNSGYMLIWESEGVVFPCELIIHHTGLKTLDINIVKMEPKGNKIKHIKECIKEIEEYCRKLGIDRARISGRVGWQRLLKDYTTERINLIKEIVQ